MTTPLKDPLHKFKGVGVLKELFPRGSIIHSYLLYAGHTELQLAADSRFVCAHTNNLVVHQFWECMLQNPTHVHQIVTATGPKLADAYLQDAIQSSWYKHPDEYIRAALFFILNRRSTTGAVSSGDVEDTHISPIILHELATFKPTNFHVLYDQEEDFLTPFYSNTDSESYHLFSVGQFTYNLFDYGKNQGIEETPVNHQTLCAALAETDSKSVLLYKFHPGLFKLYKDFNLTMINAHGIVTTSEEHCREVIVANF